MFIPNFQHRKKTVEKEEQSYTQNAALSLILDTAYKSQN